SDGRVRSALTWRFDGKNQVRRLLTGGGCRRVGSAGSTTGRPAGALLRAVVERCWARGRGAGPAHRQREPGPVCLRHGGGGFVRPVGATRAGPGCSVDNGFRSTRSQRAP